MFDIIYQTNIELIQNIQVSVDQEKMPRKIVKKVGDGITARTIKGDGLDFKSSVDSEALIKAIETMLGDANSKWRGRAGWVDEIRAHSAELEALAPKYEDSPLEYGEYFAERKTEAWYVREMSRSIDQIETYIAKKDVWAAVDSAMQLGGYVTEWSFKSRWEATALYGDEQMGARRRGGESHLKNRPELVSAFVSDLLNGKKPNGARSKTEAVAMAAEHFAVSVSTIYSYLKRSKESAPDTSDKSE